MRNLSAAPRRRGPNVPGWAWGVVLGLVILLGGWAVYVHQRYPTAAPWTSTGYLIGRIGHSHAAMQREVVGFLPYWQAPDGGYVQHDLLSEVVFFSLTADGQGNIVQTANGQADPGWEAWNSSAVRDQIAQSQIAGDKFIVSVSLQDGVQLGALLDDNGAQQRLIAALANEVRSNKLDGLNLDFEFSGASTAAHRQVFTDFGHALVAAVHAARPGSEVSIDLPPTSAEAGKPGLYDVQALGQIFDRVVVMSYDYYTPGSDVAGPVAPMSGYASKQYFFDVTTTYDDYTKAVPAGKLLMGVPLYGYDWPVKDNSKPLGLTLPQNDANGYAETVSYSRSQTDPNLSGQHCQWDATAQETWCAYTDPQTQKPREAWLEDDRSIGALFDFSKQRQLGGVALWTIGYAGSYQQPWTMVRQDFSKAK